MNGSDNQRLHAIISGRVQGVGFRAFVQNNAASLGLNGWVRNRPEGTVEVTAEGPRADLEKLLRALHRGPGTASVHEVEVNWKQATGEFERFRVKMTYL